MGETRQVATRLAVAALLHESNAFVAALTPIEAFVRLDGALLEAMVRGSGTEVDGALAGAGAEGAEAVLITAAFAHSDDPASGVAVYVAATDPGAAGALAVRLAEMMWDRRALLVPKALEPAEAVTRALRGPRRPGPVVVSDQGDNPGGGAAGDGTVLLAGFLAAGPDGPDRSGDPAVRDSLLRGDGGRPTEVLVASLYAPDAVARCAEAGVGATLELSVGGHTDDRHGPALSVTAEVLARPTALTRDSP